MPGEKDSQPKKKLKSQLNDMLTPEEAEACRSFHWNPAGYLRRKREMAVYQDERGAGHAHFTVKERPAPTTTEEAVWLSASPEKRRRLVERGLFHQIDPNQQGADADEQSQTPAVPESGGRPKLSKLEKHVLQFLIDDPQASARAVCDYFDREGIRGPKTWYPGGQLPGPKDQRQLGVIYKDKANSAIKNRIDKCVSKVRAYQEKYL